MAEVEMVAIVDANDLVIGAAPRAELADRGLNYRVVHVLVLNADGHLVLQEPAPALRKTFAWGSSVAGHVRAGETYADAARREYREELGVDPPPLESLGTTWVDDGQRRKFIGVFVARDGRAFAPDPGEVAGLIALPLAAVKRASMVGGPVSETFRKVLRFAMEHGALET